MVKYRILLLFIILLFLPFISVKAECSSSEITRLRKIANNVNVTYVFNESNNATYNLTITNLTKEIYALEATTNKKYNYNSKNNEILISNVANGTVLKLEIYATDKKCYLDKLVSKTISLPPYNPYYTDELCLQAPSHYLCQRFTKTNITEEEFKTTLTNYINSNKEEPEEPSQSNTWWDLIIEYYWVLLGLVIITGTTIIIIHHNKNKLF